MVRRGARVYIASGTAQYREREADARSREAVHVLHRAEEADLVVLIDVRLHALEAAHAVVEHGRGRVNLQRRVRHNLGSRPALVGRPLNLRV